MMKKESKFVGYSSDMSDFLIIDRALAGDQMAYEELFKKHRHKIFMFFMRLTESNVANSEDFLQDTFASAFLKLHTFNKNAGFYTWLHRIAINVFLMFCRRNKLRLVSIEELRRRQITDKNLIVAGTLENKGCWDETKKSEIGKLDRTIENVPNEILTDQLMRNLSPGFKIMVELRDLQELDYATIADKIGCSLGNAKSQRNRAIKKMRTAILRT